MSRTAVLSDAEWERIRSFMPAGRPKGGRPFADHRVVVEGIIYRYRTGVPWRDLPRDPFGPWKTVWKRHHRLTQDGTWDKISTALIAEADAAGEVSWDVSVDSTINRAHQHATNAKRPEKDIGGDVESHEPA